MFSQTRPITSQPNRRDERQNITRINPVSTVSINGLNVLLGVRSIVIQRTIELDDVVATIDAENNYLLKIPDGETLYIATEFSTPLQRVLCGSNRAFHMEIRDNARQQTLIFNRRTGFSLYCLPCIVQKIEVTAPPGEYLGLVQQEWTMTQSLFLVRDFNDNVIYVIEGPKRNFCFPHTEAVFRILNADTMIQHGFIKHGWDTDGMNYNIVTTVVEFPSTEVDPKIKALLIAATFLIEYAYFVSPKSTRYLKCWD